MISLLKYIQGPWDVSKRYLQQDLETLESAINQRWGATFGQSNVLPTNAGGTGNTAGQPLTGVNDTNVSITLGGTPLLALLKAVSITLGWIGQLALSRGGTGKDFSGVTDGQVPIGKTSDHSLNLATLTAGSGIAIVNSAASITISASGGASGGEPLTNGDGIDPELIYDSLGDVIMVI